MTSTDGHVASANSSIRIKRAAFDPASERVYFTQSNHAGIFFAQLSEIRNSVVHQPTTFVFRTKHRRDRFGAIAVDSKQNLLICCNSQKQAPSITFWSISKNISDQPPIPIAEIPCSGLPLPTGPAQRELLSIRPHKCAAFSKADSTGQSTFVALADKSKSVVYVFKAVSSRHYASTVKLDFVTIIASRARGDDIRRPRAVHFDPAGNLIVADDGPLHSRLKFYSLSDNGGFEPDDDQLMTASVYRAVFAPMKCIAASLDPSTRRPFIICGVSGFLRFPGMRRLGTSGELACFCFEELLI